LGCTDPELGWGALTKHIHVIDVPGGHRTMLARPHVVSLAKLLSPYLELPATSDRLSLPRGRRVLDASICVVIVNYRTPELCLDCLRSLEQERRSLPGLRVHLVDNCSGDHSVDVLRAGIDANHWSDWVVLLPQDRNGGFAFGNNAGIRPALFSEDPPKYFHLLNPDTIVRKDGVYQLVNYLECNPEVGIAASSLEDLEGNRRVVSFRFPSVLSEFDSGLRLGVVSRLLEPYLVSPARRPTNPCPTDWASGASLMVRRETLTRVGLMDEGFFLYFEETDFLRRAARHGHPCHYVPDSRIVHLVGKSTGLGGNSPAQRRPAYWFESRRRYFSKHHGKLYAAAADLAFVAGRSLYEARRRISRRPDHDPPHLLEDFVAHSVLLNWWRCEP
jgi:GT2 family glycosyltransferase